MTSQKLLIFVGILSIFSTVYCGVVPVSSVTKAPEKFKDCELIPSTECSKSCDGGFQLMVYDCVETVDSCVCPAYKVYNQCNNRPCLAKNATLLDVFYDAEDQAEEQSEYEYYEGDADTGAALQNIA